MQVSVVIGVVLMAAIASYSTSAKAVTLPPIVAQVQIDIKADCGAIGDGVSNDTLAFQTAAPRLATGEKPQVARGE